MATGEQNGSLFFENKAGCFLRNFLLRRSEMDTVMRYGVGLLLFFFSAVSLAGGHEPPPRMPAPADEPLLAAPVVKLIEPGVFDVEGCRIDKKKKQVSFPAQVNMDQAGQFLEYMLVENSGKLHESLLRTKISPYAIQISLLLLGVEGSLNPLVEQGEDRIPEGTPISISVSWQDQGTTKTVSLHEWVVREKKPAPNIPWVFTGSYIHDNGMFMAQMDKSIIAIYHDPAAIIDHQLSEGASDEIWFVNTDKVPSAGTEVTVAIQALK